MIKSAKADVAHIRQETQFSCMAASLASCMKAHGKRHTEADVNSIMGAGPLRGASWESLMGTAQYFGLRAVLVIPATVPQLKAWTDKGIPVVIAYNPEGRPWAHASVVFDVTGDGEDTTVHIMDPNIPDPTKTVRTYLQSDFYKIWGEKVGDSLIIRRPACAIMREVTATGRQFTAASRMDWDEEWTPEDIKQHFRNLPMVVREQIHAVQSGKPHREKDRILNILSRGHELGGEDLDIARTLVRREDIDLFPLPAPEPPKTKFKPIPGGPHEGVRAVHGEFMVEIRQGILPNMDYSWMIEVKLRYKTLYVAKVRSLADGIDKAPDVFEFLDGGQKPSWLIKV
jgi:hypothetical protein